MSIEVLLVQFLVLAFTGIVWWLARRDLASRPASPAAPQADTRELEQLCATLASLVTDLAARLEALERQQEGRREEGRREEGRREEGQKKGQWEGRGDPAPTPLPVGAGSPRPLVPASPVLSGPLPAVPPASAPAEPESDAHAPLYALLDAGVTDPAEIVRRTGLGRGEVDLILSLRARRAL